MNVHGVPLAPGPFPGPPMVKAPAAVHAKVDRVLALVLLALVVATVVVGVAF